MNKIIELETNLEFKGYSELLDACKAIVGSDGSDTGICKSIDEESMKETMGVSKVYWLKHKIVILENREIFENECETLGLMPDKFIREINDDVMKVEAFLES